MTSSRQRKLNCKLPIDKLCRSAMGFDDSCREGEFDFLAAGKRTKRIVVQLPQARPLNRDLSCFERFGGDRYFAGPVVILLVFVGGCTEPLESVAKLEMVEIPLNCARIRLHGYPASDLTGIAAGLIQ